jgi:hypothetical protein
MKICTFLISGGWRMHPKKRECTAVKAQARDLPRFTAGPESQRMA